MWQVRTVDASHAVGALEGEAAVYPVYGAAGGGEALVDLEGRFFAGRKFRALFDEARFEPRSSGRAAARPSPPYRLVPGHGAPPFGHRLLSCFSAPRSVRPGLPVARRGLRAQRAPQRARRRAPGQPAAPRIDRRQAQVQRRRVLEITGRRARHAKDPRPQGLSPAAAARPGPFLNCGGLDLEPDDLV